MRFDKILLSMLTGMLPLIAVAQSCGSVPSDPQKIWLHDEAILFKNSVLNVDADGAPNSYLLDGKGLSYTCDGIVAIENGKRITNKSNPKDWQQKCNAAWAKANESKDFSQVAIFGFLTDSKNVPIIQGEGDPLPGKAYISTTSAVIPDAPERTQRRYVDASKIPYIVLPPSFVSKYKIKTGTLAVVFRKKTGQHAFAVYADSGQLGEASVRLHQDLGSEPIKTIHGVNRAKSRLEGLTVTAVFPGKIVGPDVDIDAWNKRIKEEGASVVESFGGIKTFQICAN